MIPLIIKAGQVVNFGTHDRFQRARITARSPVGTGAATEYLHRKPRSERRSKAKREQL
jgi:hypothetical protein